MTHTSYDFILLEASGDLMWLWTLLGVVALFVLGVIAYNARSRKLFPRANVEPPEGRIVRRSGGKEPKHQGPYDYGPKAPGDPSNDPETFDFDPRTRT